jgi:CheY-like chemotaxis protein
MDASYGITITAAGTQPEGLEEWFGIRIAYTSTAEDATAMERVFDPSWDGNWEGLPFVYSLIKRMGGLISARMFEKNNVTFEIYLPSVKVAAAGLPVEQSEKPVMLLIDANAEARRVLHAHFEQHGYSVLEAGNCDEALRMAESTEQAIRLVLANPTKEDERKAELAGTLVHNRPGVHLRIFDGYRDEGHASEKRYLTKWDLLEWADDVLGAEAWALAAS